MKRTVVGALLLGCVLSGAALAARDPIVLPNGWQLSAAPDQTVATGTLPSGIVTSRDGTRAFILETGHQKPALRSIDTRTLQTLSTVRLSNAFGAPLRDPDNDGVWVGATSAFQEQIAHIDTAAAKVDRTVSLPVPFFASALAFSPDGKTLAVAGDLANRVAFIDVAGGSITATVPTGRHPAALAYDAQGATLYVADRAESQLDVVDTKQNVVTGRITVGIHPAALLRDGNRLYVADSDDDDVAVVALPDAKVIQHAALPFFSHGAIGASPDALFMDGDRLYVPCGAANAIAVFRRTATGLEALGAIPAGWYPTGVAAAADGTLLLVNGKGENSHADSAFRPSSTKEYIADNLVGSIRKVARPSTSGLQTGLASVQTLGAPFAHRRPPLSTVVRPAGPIRHVVYVVKENRTYDQILGDIAGADGDPALVMFGSNVTPNEHAIARRFGIFDRFFTDAHVSADGHSWSLAAFANDYLERMWPSNYAQRRPYYDFEDGAEASVPHSGFLWDAAGRAGISYRNYGEFVTAGPGDDGIPTSTTHRALQEHTDFSYPTFDMNLRDIDRFAEWKREFDTFERTRTLPQLEIVRFPRDHTAGTQTGKNTPEAMVADNDLAVGKLIEAVSHSRDWASSAIFILEDDAQNGPDHVDEQRSTFYLASPYAKGGIIHAHFSTSGVVRTIEILLGLHPLSAYDDGAEPLTAAFRATPDLQPYSATAPNINLDAKNARTAYAADASAKLDFAQADDVDAATLNSILWGAVKGANAAHPGYGAFR